MALRTAHQICSLIGTPTQSGSGKSSREFIVVVNVSALWKSPATNLRCKAIRFGTCDGLFPPASPYRSPVFSRSLPAVSAASQAFATELEEAMAADDAAALVVREYKEGGSKGKGSGVPVYVMMPLDSVTMGNTVNRKKAMNVSLQALKNAGVEGVMMDVWWGLVERNSPGAYNWGGYTDLLEMAKKHGLKVQAVMSFHQCGGNVGDSCT